MKILLSVKPEHVDKMISGEKLYEYRKTIFKNPQITTIVIYATLPVGRVVGEFNIEDIIEEHPVMLWKKTKKASGISEEFFMSYFKDRETAFAIKIRDFIKYDVPKMITEILPSGYIPQSFCYLV